MDFFHILMPISGVTIFWPGLVILGFGVGILGGFFGMGGAWMVTPGLNILGFPMAFAIGTDIAHMAGKSIVSTMRHGKFGNIDYRLALIMVIGTIFGLELGAQMIMWLERLGKVDITVRWIYVILLLLITLIIFIDTYRNMRKRRAARESGQVLDKLSTGLEWHKALHRMRIPPVVHFEKAQVTCSAWLPISISLFTGWLAGVLGIGGGLIRMPSLVYFVGCPTHIAVGTDLFECLISGLYGTASYSMKGRTELLAALIMLVGAAIGAQIGTVATKYIKGYGIRIAFGTAVFGCCISIILKLIPEYVRGTAEIMGTASTWLILGLVSLLSLYIFIKMVDGARKEIAAKRKSVSLQVLLVILLCLFQGCGEMGHIEQGRVVDYDRENRTVAIIHDNNSDPEKPDYVLPPVIFKLPDDLHEMGPEPKAGKRIRLDTEHNQIVILDQAAGRFTTIEYNVISLKAGIERDDPLVYDWSEKKAKDFPVIDNARRTIIIYSKREKTLVTFTVPDKYSALPPETWSAGDEARIYYRENGIALRFMNITKTDIFEK